MSEPDRLHLIGVGGSGMLPLALLLKQAGHTVTGRDAFCSPERLALLKAHGITVSSEADPTRVKDADCVVVSPAIPETDIERRAARRDGVTVKTRSQMLAELIAERINVCVAGSHGKSTTTAMLIHILSSAGQHDFGYMLGASFADPDSAPARLGAPDAPFLTEACEAYGALAQWQPSHAILTNLDDDHADHYGGLAGLTQAFANFLSRLPEDGVAVACGDDPRVVKILREARCPALTYGFGAENQLRAVQDSRGSATVFLDGRELGPLRLRVPGNHNRLNALAAFGMALTLGVEFHAASDALAKFDGIQRRLQRIPTENGLTVFDDFAHHPAEIAASIAALRETTKGRLVAILEPQLHSRVARMAVPIAKALSSVDRCFILPVASLGEAAQAEDGDAALADACRSRGLSCRHVSDQAELLLRLREDLQDGDTLIVMAGNSGAGIAQRLARALSRPGLLTPAPSVLCGDKRPFPPDLLTLVAGHLAKQPAAPAVEMGHRRLTYADLVLRAGDLASILEAKGVRAGDGVGVCLGRTVDRVTAFLAVLQLGGIFVPLDPALPDERLQSMLENVGARTVVVNTASPALPDIGLTFVNCDQLPNRGESRHVDWRPRQIADDTLAYVIFTSGTTGGPKAVEITRGALANYAVAASRHFQIAHSARVSQISGFGFDVSIGRHGHVAGSRRLSRLSHGSPGDLRPAGGSFPFRKPG